MQTLFALSLGLPDIVFRGWFPQWLALILALLGVAAVGVLYAYEAGRLGFLPRVLMATVRMAIVVAVAVLLLRPVLTSKEDLKRPRPVAVLIDVSQSMNSADPRPNQPDLWRVAIAYNRTDPTKGIPADPPGNALSGPDAPPDRPKRIEVARAALTNPKLDLLNRLGEIGPVEPATFGSRRDGRPAGDFAWIRTLTGTDPQTALADQVNELLARDPNDLPAAIVLITDGRENASRTSLTTLADECKRLNIPIHVYAVGSSAFGQLQIRGVDVPEGVFVDDAVPVRVRYHVSGVPRGHATVTLKYGERVVATKEVPIQSGPVDRVETLVFVPTKEDANSPKPQLSATVTVTTATGGRPETLTDELVKGVKVVDRKLKVLVIDSLPRFDFKFLQRALKRDRRVEAKFYLTDGDEQSMTADPTTWQSELARTSDGELSLSEDEFRKLLLTFDLLILGDLPAKYFTTRHQTVIRAFVTEGGGLIHQAGRWHGPATWAGTTMGDLLPVEFESVRFATEDVRRPDPFYPVLVDAAARNPLVSLEDEPLDNAELFGKKDQPDDPADSARRGKKLPPIHWYYPVTKLKTAAEAYLVHPRDKTPGNDPRPMPLLAGHYFGKGFVLFVGFDETWRWRFNEADRYFGRFWSQGVYVAGVPRVFGTKLTQLSIDTNDPMQGKTGQVFARLHNPDFKPITAERVVAQLERLDADPSDPDRSTKVILRPLSGQSGEYVTGIPFNKAGRFKLTVLPSKDGNPEGIDPADLEYRVSLRPNDELAPGPMDELRMKTLAEHTGGRLYREEDLHNLPRSVRPQTSPLVIQHETVLWDRWWVMATLIVLLTIEWVLRKFNSLS